MAEKNYLQWLAEETPTRWWHDSAETAELLRGLQYGASGVTINPVLAATAVQKNPGDLLANLKNLSDDLPARQRAEMLMQAAVSNAASIYEPIYGRTAGREGYACAQVEPSLAGDRAAMLEMAKRFHSWASNIAVKLPVTAAGLDVLEECAALGITVTATVSFTVPQVIAIAERYRMGLARARKAGISPGQCFAVIMIGRLDDYLTDVAKDRKADAPMSDLQLAGIAVTKRSYSLYKERGYEAVLLVAAHRGTYHVTELAGADIILSIHPRCQDMLLQPGVPRDANRVNTPVAPEVIERLATIPEFVRAYEPDGLRPEDFITYGVTQRTLAQFQVSWSQMESFRV